MKQNQLKKPILGVSLYSEQETMKEIEGYTADEIMLITGCTADNLRRNLSRARTKIRETYIKIMMKGIGT